MAKKTITQIIDDLDGSKDAKSYSFAWQGTAYTIDLSNKNFKALDKLLQAYIKAGTKVSPAMCSTSVNETMVSNIGTSIACPTPVRDRWSNAASIACVATNPTTRSQIKVGR